MRHLVRYLPRDISVRRACVKSHRPDYLQPVHSGVDAQRAAQRPENLHVGTGAFM